MSSARRRRTTAPPGQMVERLQSCTSRFGEHQMMSGSPARAATWATVIGQAEHYISVEQRCFVSSPGDKAWPAADRIGEAILKCVEWAVEKQRMFRYHPVFSLVQRPDRLSIVLPRSPMADRRDAG